MSGNRPSIFVSYAHKDGMDFTSRLAFALELYSDTYWDRRLQAGPFPEQLEREISARDIFILVMTPYSIASDWCRRELDIAIAKGKKIALARVFGGDGTVGSDLVNTYTYADFSADFEKGFRHLTQLIYGEPLSSWEAMAWANDQALTEHACNGRLPAFIVMELLEFLISVRLYGVIQDDIAERYADRQITTDYPRTVDGVRRMSMGLSKWFPEVEQDFIVLTWCQEIVKIAELFLTTQQRLNDRSHKESGVLAQSVINQSRIFLSRTYISSMKLRKQVELQNYFEFELAEKLRELIFYYARRARNIY